MSTERVKIYNCEVRHGGNIMHSLTKDGITNREIRVLRAIHGPDGVVNVKEAGERDVNQTEEAFELALKYARDSQRPQYGAKLVERVLNVNMEGFDAWLTERRQLDEMMREERLQKEAREAARMTAAREAAEAKVRSEMADERARAAA